MVAPRRSRKKVEALAPEATPPDPGVRLLRLPLSQAGVRVTEDSALTLGALFACVRVISEDLAGLPWRVLESRPGGNGSDERPDDPADWLLHFQANPEVAAFQWREVLIAHALTWGNGYAEIERDGAGRPVWLWQLTPDRVEPVRADETILRQNRLTLPGVALGDLVYEVAEPSGPPTYLPAADVFHLRGLGFDGLRGYSVVGLAARSIGVGISLDDNAANLYANDSTPGGLLSHPGKLSDAARQNLRQTWQARHGGPSRRRTVAILEEGMSWTQTGLPPEDAQLLQQRQLTPAEICRWFRVKPHKIADLSKATFSNIEQQSIEHVSDTLLPWGRRLEAEANIKLFGRTNRGRRYTKLNFNALLRGDAAARASFYTQMLDRGVFSINDVLGLEDRNPIGPDGDKRLVPLNMQLLEDAGEDLAPPAGAPPARPEPPDDPMPGAQDMRAVRPALLPVFREATGRVARRGEHRLADARKRQGGGPAPEGWGESFLADHRAYLLEALAPPALALAELAGGGEIAARAGLAAYAQRHAAELAGRLAAGTGAGHVFSGSDAEAENLMSHVLAASAATKGGQS